MKNGFRRTAVAAASVLALGVGAAAWAASAASTSPAAIGRCTAGHLEVRDRSIPGGGTAGTIYSNLDFTNTGRSTCYLDGYPGVSAITKGGAQIGQAATRNDITPARVIDLRPGATVHATLGYIGVIVDPSCKEETSAFLKVYPPDSTVANRVPEALTVCRTGQSVLTITRVRSGA